MTQDLNSLRIEKNVKAGVGRRRRRRWPFFALAAALLLSVAWGFGLFASRPEVETAKVVLVFPSQSLTLLTASGYVTAERKASLATKATGRLVELNVEEGSRVEAGQVVARIESEDIEAARTRAARQLEAARRRVEQAEAELTDAARNHKRLKRLADLGYLALSERDYARRRLDVAEAALDEARAERDAAEAALAEAEANLEYARIRAPFDGVILTKNADLGDLITPMSASTGSKAAVVTLADMRSLQVEADVSEAHLGAVAIGQPCEIVLDAFPDKRFAGHVHMIVPTADRTKATVMVKIRFDRLDPAILPEMSAKAAFLKRPLTQDEQRPRLCVPASALTRRDGRELVFALKDGRAAAAPVKTGEQLGDMVEILSGLNQGETVIVNPPKGLADGQDVAVKEG